jgi:hypothetical protein
MANNVGMPPVGVDPASAAPSVSDVPKARAKAPPIGPKDSDVRLLIQKSDTGRYVYTVLDRASGRVIAQIPSTDVVRLMDASAYAAGTLFKTKV